METVSGHRQDAEETTHVMADVDCLHEPPSLHVVEGQLVTLNTAQQYQ